MMFSVLRVWKTYDVGEFRTEKNLKFYIYKTELKYSLNVVYYL